MKKYVNILLIGLFFTVGCEDKATDETEVDPLVGVWAMTTASMKIYSNPIQTITYNADAENSETMVLGDDGVYSAV